MPKEEIALLSFILGTVFGGFFLVWVSITMGEYNGKNKENEQ